MVETPLQAWFFSCDHTEVAVLEQLFQHDTSVPSVPVSTQQPQSFVPDSSGGHSPTSAHHLPLNTLDEPVWETILRDVKRIYGNLKLVVFPFGSRDQQTTALRNWDLWGPMVSCMCYFINANALISHVPLDQAQKAC